MYSVGRKVIAINGSVTVYSEFKLSAIKHVITKETPKTVTINLENTDWRGSRLAKDKIGLHETNIYLANQGQVYFNGYCFEEDYADFINKIKTDIEQGLLSLTDTANKILANLK